MKKFLEFLKKCWSVVWHTDTLAHGGCCAAISLAVFVIFATPAFALPLGIAVAAGFIISMLAGLFVEFVQWNICKGWTKEEAIKDIIRDGIGIALAIIPELIYICN